MVARFKRRLVTPTIVPIGVMIVVGILIVAIGETLLGLFDSEASSELARVELWVAIGLAVAVIALGALVSSLPRTGHGFLEREVLIGSQPFFAPEPPPVDVAMRRGSLGTFADVGEGYTLYARNGPLARVLGLLPGEEEFGRRRRGLIYAAGLYGASDELWIPVEAVLAVYPETRSAFLAVKGDETEHFGWNRAPQSFRRVEHTSHFPSSF